MPQVSLNQVHEGDVLYDKHDDTIVSVVDMNNVEWHQGDPQTGSVTIEHGVDETETERDAVEFDTELKHNKYRHVADRVLEEPHAVFEAFGEAAAFQERGEVIDLVVGPDAPVDGLENVSDIRAAALLRNAAHTETGGDEAENEEVE